MTKSSSSRGPRWDSHIELAGIGPSPLACSLLSDLGADIVRIDRMVAADLGLAFSGDEPTFDVVDVLGHDRPKASPGR